VWWEVVGDDEGVFGGYGFDFMVWVVCGLLLFF